jgi:chemotaxis protein MotB
VSKEQKRPIIVKKVIKKAQGHHGGSWKVAYADFVTAMMAFFLVMWILGMDENVRKAIEEYFSQPVGMRQGYASGASPLGMGNTPTPLRLQQMRLVQRSAEESQFREIGKKIQAELEGPDGLGKIAAQIEVVIAEEGLRIELIEGGDGETFFAFGSAALQPAAERALTVIGRQLIPASSARIVVEGHTDAVPFGSRRYSNWELSSDRAQAARRALEGSGVPPLRIEQIRGYADRHLRNPDDPLHPSNRRTTILLPFSGELKAADGERLAPAEAGET